MKINIYLFGPIDTSNLDGNGEYVKKRREYLKQKLENARKNIEKEKQKKEQLQKELQDSNLDGNKPEIKKRLEKLEKKEEEKRKCYEKIEEEIKKRQYEIDNDAKKHNIITNILGNFPLSAKVGVFGSLTLRLSGLVVGSFCPPVGIALFFGGGAGILASFFLGIYYSKKFSPK